MTNPSAAMRRGLSPARFGGAVSVVGLSMVLAAMQAASAAGPGATPITLGRVLGLTAAYGALIQVILRARIPSIERGFGVRVLGQWHACLGATVVLLAVGHALLISTGYAAAAHTTIAGEFSALVAQYPWLPEALAALLILISVAALATRRTRRVFRYEAWHLIHCSVYVAVLLALGHQLLVGDSFQHGMPSRTAWLVLYLVTVGMVLWFRVLRPFWIS